MFCSNCGSANPDDSNFCSVCGSKLARSGPEATPTKSEGQSTDPSLNEHTNDQFPKGGATSGPTGVGGWLTLLCVGLTITGPIYLIIEFATATRWIFNAAGTIVLFVFCFGTATYSLIIGIRLWRSVPGTEKQAKIFLIISASAAVAMALVISGFSGRTGDAITLIVLSGISISIWWPYLTNSTRVANTYRVSDRERYH